MVLLLQLLSAALVAMFTGCAGAQRNGSGSTTKEAVQAFLERYQALTDAFDPAVADLFADDARITGLRHTADGVKEIELTGAQFKQVLRAVLPAAPKSDREVLSNVDIRISDAGALITAHRYSRLKCTHDDKFAMDLEPDAQGVLHIVAAVQQSWATSQCGLGEGKTPAQRFDEIVSSTAPVLPIQVDKESRLDGVAHADNVLSYSYTFTTVEASQLDVKALELALRERLVQDSCHAFPHLAAALKDGGSIRYAYADRGGQPLLIITVRRQDCS